MENQVTVAALAAAGLTGPMLERKDDTSGANQSMMVKDAINNIQQTFAEFRAKNDERLTAIEKKGQADPLTDATLAKLNEQMDIQQKAIDAMALDLKRPQLSGGSKSGNMSVDEQKHRAAFADFFRKGNEDGLADIQQKALNMGVGMDGGYAVPKVIDSQVASLMQNISPIRSIATVVQTSTSDYRKLVNLHGTAATWQGETSTTADSATPKLKEIAPPSGWLEARPRATQQSLDDGMFDFEAWLADEVATAFAVSEGAAFINGNGTNKPRGFLAGPAPVATADATRAFGTLQFIASRQAAAMPSSFEPFIDMIYSIKAGHRQGSNFVSNSLALSAIRKLKDADGNYMWQPSLIAGQPSTFLGYSVVEAEDMPAIAANAFPLAFGNFKAGYLIADRFGVRIQRDPFTAKPYVEFYTTKRVGGDVIDSEAIKLLKISV
ncbi:MAG: phage major capsid protein [Ahrensia sp.]|nr:phage major capsid protein [Ahrensia sp.]